MLERQWWGDVAAQLADAIPFAAPSAARRPGLAQQARRAAKRTIAALGPLAWRRPGRAARPAATASAGTRTSRSQLAGLRGRCSACKARASRCATRWSNSAPPLLFAAWPGASARSRRAAVVRGGGRAAGAGADRLGHHGAARRLTLPLLWAGWWRAALGWLPACRWIVALGCGRGLLSLWSVYWLFKLATGKEGMGYGDFKLLAALGAWLGWQAILPIVLMASVIGAVVGIVMKFSGALREGRFVPFGPFLAGGGLVVLLVGLPGCWAGWAGRPRPCIRHRPDRRHRQRQEHGGAGAGGLRRHLVDTDAIAARSRCRAAPGHSRPGRPSAPT
jgi:leader peptidase (prepilin peptidase)/N-methyltransferase